MRSLYKWIILIITASFLTVWLILPTYFSWRMSSMMETTARLRQVFLNPKELIFKNLRIDNIPGYMQIPVAMTAKNIDIEAPLTTYAKDEIVIDRIHADGIHLGLVFDSDRKTTGNWTHIMTSTTPTDAEKKAHPRKVIIKELVVTNVTGEVYYKSNGNRYNIPPIKMIKIQNLKSDGGIPTEQIMHTALGQTLHQIFIHQNMPSMLEGIFPFLLPLLLIPAI